MYVSITSKKISHLPFDSPKLERNKVKIMAYGRNAMSDAMSLQLYPSHDVEGKFAIDIYRVSEKGPYKFEWA